MHRPPDGPANAADRIARLASLPVHVRAALGRYSDSISERFGDRTRELVLFGSYARGEAHDESDVDLLLVVDDLTEAERDVGLDLAWAADASDPEGAWAGLSPLVFSTADAARLRSFERRLWVDIAEEGVPLVSFPTAAPGGE